MTELEKQNKLLQIQKEDQERRDKMMYCRFCMFYKPLKNAFGGKCLSKVNTIKNKTKIWESTTAPRTVYHDEIHNCFRQG